MSPGKLKVNMLVLPNLALMTPHSPDTLFSHSPFQLSLVFTLPPRALASLGWKATSLRCQATWAAETSLESSRNLVLVSPTSSNCLLELAKRQMAPSPIGTFITDLILNLKKIIIYYFLLTVNGGSSKAGYGQYLHPSSL